MEWKTALRPTRLGMGIFFVLLLTMFIRVPFLGCFSYCPPDTMCTQECQETPLFYLPVAALWTPSDTAHFAVLLFVPLAACYYLIAVAISHAALARRKN